MGKLNDISFTRVNGGVNANSVGNDHISAMLLFVPSTFLARLNAEGNQEYLDSNNKGIIVKNVKKIQDIEEIGITDVALEATVSQGEVTLGTDPDYQYRLVHYHVAEFLRIQNRGTLHIGFFEKQAGNCDDNGYLDFSELALIQNNVNGEVRQFGIYDVDFQGLLSVTNSSVIGYGEDTGEPAGYPTVAEVLVAHNANIQTKLDAIYADHKPAIALYVPQLGTTTIAAIKEIAVIVAGQNRVSNVIAEDCLTTGLASQLRVEIVKDVVGYAIGCVGLALGCVSKAAVHENIAWVQAFPLSLGVPGFITGELLTNQSTSTLEDLNDAHFLFVRTHVGNAGNYWNDSHNNDVDTSDFRYIEGMRTMDKAEREVRVALLPDLNRPIYVDPATGYLTDVQRETLKTIAEEPLTEMIKKGELSGAQVLIAADQSVLTTSTINMVIENVGVGVSRNFAVKIGYVTKLSE